MHDGQAIQASLVPALRRWLAELLENYRVAQANKWRSRMRTFIKRICVALLAAMLLQPVLAQPGGGGGGGGQRMQGGGINYAPEPAVYSVVLVDARARTVRLRAADGRTGLVHVAEGVYDLSTLKAGDKIRVDFAEPEAANSKLRAASIYPEK
jgi:hypothetical protein